MLSSCLFAESIALLTTCSRFPLHPAALYLCIFDHISRLGIIFGQPCTRYRLASIPQSQNSVNESCHARSPHVATILGSPRLPEPRRPTSCSFRAEHVTEAARSQVLKESKFKEHGRITPGGQCVPHRRVTAHASFQRSLWQRATSWRTSSACGHGACTTSGNLFVILRHICQGESRRWEDARLSPSR